MAPALTKPRLQSGSGGIRFLVNSLGFLLAWSFLNVVLNLNYPAAEPHLLAPLQPVPEVAVLLAGLCAAVRLGMPFHPAVYLPLTALFIIVRLFRMADVLVPQYLNRSFNLYIDVQYLPDLLHLLYHTVSFASLIGFAALALGLTLTLGWAVWRAFKTVHAYLAAAGQRWFCLALAAVLAGSWIYPIAVPAGKSRPIFSGGIFQRMLQEIDFIFNVHGRRAPSLAAIRAAEQRPAGQSGRLDRLRGVDVYLFFIESYGHTVFADPRHYSVIAPVLENFEKKITAQGFAACSNFLDSPTYGGASWLAHASLASGVKLDSQMHYNLLLTSAVKPLARYLNDNGYRTVVVMPGTVWPWPEGAFFGHRVRYAAADFDYRGPAYGWSPMPDQYVLDYIHRREVQKSRQPLFIEYLLTSSHAPFHRQPPYLKDWSQIGNGAVFHEKEMVTFPVVWPDLTNASGAYAAAIVYDLNVLAAYLEQFVEDDALVLILGDHQPNRQITGPECPWSVPVHVISRNRHLLQSFVQLGYTPGLDPGQPPPHAGMQTFLGHFLQVFSTEATTAGLQHRLAGRKR